MPVIINRHLSNDSLLIISFHLLFSSIVGTGRKKNALELPVSITTVWPPKTVTTVPRCLPTDKRRAAGNRRDSVIDGAPEIGEWSRDDMAVSRSVPTVTAIIKPVMVVLAKFYLNGQSSGAVRFLVTCPA
jgi:hypothetical protein